MIGARLLGGLFLLLSGYYLRFYLVRHEPATFAQLMALVAAAVLLLSQERRALPNPAWFQGWRPTAWQAWVALVVGAGAVIAVFVAMDAGSHSASDTLNRIAPTYALLAALAVKLHAEHSTRPEPAERLAH